MKYFLLILIIATIPLIIEGQSNYGYRKGTIITSKNDTIPCFIELQFSYENRVKYQMVEGDLPQSMKIKEIKNMTVLAKYFENIQVGKKERLLQLVIDGKIRLYKYVESIETVISKTPTGSQSTTRYEDHYFLRKGDSILEISKQIFSENASTYFSECISLNDKIKNGTYQYVDLEKIVVEYNACNN